MNNESSNISEDPIYQRYCDNSFVNITGSPDLERMFENIYALSPEDRAIVLSTLARYEEESEKTSYKTNPEALVRLIGDEKLLDESEYIVDLGAGPGDLLDELDTAFQNNQESKQIVGIDLSPGFVQNFNAKKPWFGRQPVRSCMYVGLIDGWEVWRSKTLSNRRSVISVLTLDRLTNPRELIKNMARFNCARILGTLLPVVPEDDNPSRQGTGKIVYTREPNRIVPGRDAKEDRDRLLALLKDAWGKKVDVTNVPYEVTSSGDTQQYNLAVFYSRN